MKCGVACSHTPGLISILDSSYPHICPNSETFILYEIHAGKKKKYEIWISFITSVNCPWGVFGRQNGSGAGFALQFVFHVSFHSPNAPYSSGTKATTVNIVLTVAPVKGTQLHHAPWTKEKRKNFFLNSVLIGLIVSQCWGLCTVGLLFNRV